MAARRHRRGGHEEEHENNERWLLTYADMITLLMVLFIVLFAVSQIDSKKFEKFHDGLAKSFGNAKVIDGGSGVLEGSTKQALQADESRADQQALMAQAQAVLDEKSQVDTETARMDDIKSSITTALAKRGYAGAVQFRQEKRGLVIDIVTDSVLFDLGSADLRPEGRKVLDAVAPALVKLPNRIAVEGHTDNVPITTGRYPSNWELSTERATTVLRYILSRGVAADRLSAAGYADTRPLVPNDTAAHRSRNRRVAIVVLSAASTPADARTP